MKVWEIYGVKKWFIVSLIALMILLGGFIACLCLYFLFQDKSHIFLLLTIFIGIYFLASIYVLAKQVLLRFFPYLKKEREEYSANITYVIPSSNEESVRPLGVYIAKDGKKRAAALIGIFPFSGNLKTKLPEGKKVKISKIKGEFLALLHETR